MHVEGTREAEGLHGPHRREEESVTSGVLYVRSHCERERERRQRKRKGRRRRRREEGYAIGVISLLFSSVRPPATVRANDESGESDAVM